MTGQSINCRCTECSCAHSVNYFPNVNVGEDPELKDKILDGSLFTWTCPECGKVNLAVYPMVYHDPQQSLMLVLSPSPISASGLPEGYVGRQVRTPGELIEKIKIFEAGLDDILVEMCKFVTVKELKKDVSLKFFKLEGADSEITFTYPENSNMEMVVTGMGLYHDCAGIVERNPRIRDAATGLAQVNDGFLRQFFE